MEAATRCTEGSCRTASCRPWWGTFRPFYEVPCCIKCASRVHSARGFPHMVCCSGSARTGPADTDLYGTRHLVTTGGSQHILFMYVVSHRQNPWWLSCSAVPAAAACLLKGPAFFFGHSCFGMVLIQWFSTPTPTPTITLTPTPATCKSSSCLLRQSAFVVHPVCRSSMMDAWCDSEHL